MFRPLDLRRESRKSKNPRQHMKAGVLAWGSLTLTYFLTGDRNI
ncbi:hypothetical protein GGR36_000001, partial [Niveibacterium umoris]|nr:hypothetical protein [Niveibacterium umoris]